jgi:exodeoxyribonuclease VII large subunit
VWHDICQVLARRWPLARIVLSACQVQGDAAPATIVRALGRLERWSASERSAGRPDDAPTVTILARGGGSLEDLWPFNDERVVRAVVGHGLPVVCGVGHETDVTLADFAADVRAPTPSAAAELVVPDRAEARIGLMADLRRLHAVAGRRLALARTEVGQERRALDRLAPGAQLAAARERAGLLLDRATRRIGDGVATRRAAMDRLDDRLRVTLPGRVARNRETVDRRSVVLPLLVARRVAAARAALEAGNAALGVLGPQATLERGFAIVRRSADGRIVRAPDEAGEGTRLAIRVAGGEFPGTATRRSGS